MRKSRLFLSLRGILVLKISFIFENCLMLDNITTQQLNSFEPAINFPELNFIMTKTALILQAGSGFYVKPNEIKKQLDKLLWRLF